MRCGMKNNKYAIVLLMVGFISLTAVRGFAGSVSMDYHDNSRTIEKGAGSQTAGIYATAGENGYILMSAGIVSAGTSDVLTVDRGTSQSITIVPYNKYKVADVLVDGVSVGAVTSYTIPNIDRDHAIIVTFELKPPQISLSPSGFNFGSVKVGTSSAPQSFTVSNLGGQDLVINSVILAGSNPTDFGLSGDFCTGHTLAAQTSCNFQSTFSPALMSAGFRSASVRVASNDPVTPTSNVALSGTGVNPQLTVVKNDVGAGTVTSLPAGINCGTVCVALFTPGTITLSAALGDAEAFFVGWSGGGCSGTGDCTLTLAADTTVTATFSCVAPNPVRILRTGATYSTLGAAYIDAQNGDVIQIRAGANLLENLTLGATANLNGATSVTIEGGYDCGFTSYAGGEALLNGELHVAGGTVKLRNIHLVK